MKFNIKDWQDKHLIKESKLKEIDFKDKSAFDKYQAKHKMRSTTKVNVAGKDTTAGEAGGKEKEASGDDIESKIDQYLAQTNRPDSNDGGGDEKTKTASASKMTPQQKEDTVYGAFEMLGDTLTRGMEYDEKMMQGDLESIKKSGMSIDDAKAELENLMGQTEQEDDYGDPSWPEESKEAMYSHLDSIYSEAGEQGGKTKSKPVEIYPSMEDAEAIMDEFQEGGLEKGVDYEETTAYGDDIPNEIVALSDKAKEIVDQYEDEDEDEDYDDEGRSNESIAPRSTRIQEVKIYRTIQQLKGLERDL